MPEFNNDEYYRIYDEMINVGESHPFDCYLLLPENNRIVLIVKKRELFPASKLPKFSRLKRSGMFIHISDKKSYFEYLRERIRSTKNRDLLESLKRELRNGPVEGIPEISEFNIFEKSEENKFFLSNIEILNKYDQVIIMGTGPERLGDEYYKTVVSGKKLHGEMKVNTSKAIGNILEEIIRIKGKTYSSDNNEIYKIVTEEIKSNVDVIARSISDLPSGEFEVLVKAFKGFNMGYKNLMGWANRLNESPANFQDEESVFRSETDIENFLLWAKEIRNLINLSGSKSEESDVIYRGSSAKSEEIKRATDLRKIVGKARDLLTIYHKNRGLNKERFRGVKTSWYDLMTSAKKRLTPKEDYTGCEVFRTANELEFDSFGANMSYNSLLMAINEACRHLGIDEADFLLDKPVVGVDRVIYSKNEIEAKVPSPLEDDAEKNELIEQNKLLSLELKNACFIIESCNIQISELCDILGTSKKYQIRLEEEFADLRCERDHLSENLIHQKVVLESVTKDTMYFKDHIKELSAIINKFKNNRKLLLDVVKYDVKPIREKMEIVNVLMDDVDILATKVNSLGNINEKLKEKVEDSQEMKKRLGKRIAKSESEKYTILKEKNSLDLRYKVMKGLLEIAKKSLMKIDVASNKLRRENKSFVAKMYLSMDENKKKIKEKKQDSHKMEGYNTELKNARTELKRMTKKDKEQSEMVRKLNRNNSKLIDEKEKLVNAISKFKKGDSLHKSSDMLELSEKLIQEQELSKQLKDDLADTKEKLNEMRDLTDALT